MKSIRKINKFKELLKKKTQQRMINNKPREKQIIFKTNKKLHIKQAKEKGIQYSIE